MRLLKLYIINHKIQTIIALNANKANLYLSAAFTAACTQVLCKWSCQLLQLLTYSEHNSHSVCMYMHAHKIDSRSSQLC